MIRQTGFLLTSHSFDNSNRCEIQLYCVGPEGPFLALFTDQQPLFFIQRNCPASFTAGMDRRPLQLRTISGADVDGLYFPGLNAFFEGRRKLQEQGVQLFESDLRAEDRFLMERFIKGALVVEGDPVTRGSLKVFHNPRIAPTDYRPRLSILSLDIETGSDGSLYSVALHATAPEREVRKVLMRADSGATTDSPKETPGWLEYCRDEVSLLRRFLELCDELDPDLIIGWHVAGFDLSFLSARAERHRIPFLLGRGKRPAKILQSRTGLYSVGLEGRLVIDGPPTLRTAFYNFENYKLETVAQELLGRGKDITPDEDKVAEIERRFREDKEALGFYNLEDAVLVTEIFQTTAILDQLVTRSLITGLPMDKQNMSVAAFDFFMLPALHRQGYVALDTADVTPGAHAAGGLVFTSEPGLYPHVVVLDFKSLYPTIMRTFFIDPFSLHEGSVDPVQTPAGISFSRTRHVLPEFLEELMDTRGRAKKEGDAPLAQAVKILMNSFYGVMGTTGCRFYHPDLPSAITGTGQWILKTAADRLRKLGYRVLYGDTDSLFVCLKESEWSDPDAAGLSLSREVDQYMAALILQEYQVESRLELEYEKHYLKFFLPAMRNSSEGARKRYAGLLSDGSLEFKGLETVRSDWTPLAREFQKELFRRFFDEQELSEWIRNFVEELKQGLYDDKLVYRKRLTRDARDYIKNRPPHVKAALKLDPQGTKKLKEIRYIITAEGPEPLELFSGGADYRHYIEKQIAPIADGVLFALGQDFDSLLQGRQLDLFS